MKIAHILIFFISLCFTQNAFCQEEKVNDTIVKKSRKYGIRVGIDASKIARTAFENNYKGLELIGDIRISKDVYIAAEIGNENVTLYNDFLNTTTKGTYFKVGVDYNMFNNSIGMDNMIYSGFRVGVSNFNSTLNEYQVYQTNQYWSPALTVTSPQEFNQLNAIWAEVMMGIKAEVLNNLYISLNLQLKYLASQKVPDNFDNLYIPGFNATTDGNSVGVGYSLGLAYRLPIIKK